MKKYPWTFEEYLSECEHNKTHTYSSRRKFIDIPLTDSILDIVGFSLTRFEEPTFLSAISDSVLYDENNKPYQVDNIHPDLTHHANKLICFGNTYHCYGYIKLSGVFQDITDKVWDIVKHHGIDYSNMTTDDFIIIKMLLSY